MDNYGIRFFAMLQLLIIHYQLSILYLYNMLAPVMGFKGVGINLLSALIAGGMGVPGGILLLCAAICL